MEQPLKFVGLLFQSLAEVISVMQVFSAFGFVHKITTFEKTAGFQVYKFNSVLLWFLSMGSSTSKHESVLYLCQALVQFSDSETASAAKNALDGRSIPR